MNLHMVPGERLELTLRYMRWRYPEHEFSIDGNQIRYFRRMSGDRHISTLNEINMLDYHRQALQARARGDI